ncbi:hypothetical protein CH278_12770 [Rhodococcus sp. 05-2254-5]|nr:hypothetical protein CH278_12770 [Rhodococcus sp. 05-2254-5]OZE51015.1 hypothetical protein CH269_25715 [Rhodococcus sp. 05-2254-1]OZF42480.1 hypothetical protein CH291_26175 [Rhodococcus sp. 14-1411-2a]
MTAEVVPPMSTPAVVPAAIRSERVVGMPRLLKYVAPWASSTAAVLLTRSASSWLNQPGFSPEIAPKRTVLSGA